MYKDFQLEQYGRLTIEVEEGFIVYNVYEDNSAYVHILYIKPEYRKTGIGLEMGQMVVDKHNIKTLFCYVDLTSNNPELSLKAMLGGGFKVFESKPDKIVLTKEV